MGQQLRGGNITGGYEAGAMTEGLKAAGKR